MLCVFFRSCTPLSRWVKSHSHRHLRHIQSCPAPVMQTLIPRRIAPIEIPWSLPPSPRLHPHLPADPTHPLDPEFPLRGSSPLRTMIRSPTPTRLELHVRPPTTVRSRFRLLSTLPRIYSRCRLRRQGIQPWEPQWHFPSSWTVDHWKSTNH